MLLLGKTNTSSQTVLTGQSVNLGNTYRTFTKKLGGLRTFESTSNSVTLNQSGIYHVTATAIVSSATVGDVTLALFVNGVQASGAISTETITTAVTEFRTAIIDYYILVDSACVLNVPATNTQTLTLVNTGIGSTITNVVFNVEKVL